MPNRKRNATFTNIVPYYERYILHIFSSIIIYDAVAVHNRDSITESQKYGHLQVISFVLRLLLGRPRQRSQSNMGPGMIKEIDFGDWTDTTLLGSAPG